jgi:hypothetical protein
MPSGQAVSRVRGGARQRRLPPSVPGPRSASATGHSADVPSRPSANHPGRFGQQCLVQPGHRIRTAPAGQLRQRHGVRHLAIQRDPANRSVCIVTFVPPVVSQECADWLAGLKAETERRGLDPRDFGAVYSIRPEWVATHPAAETCAAAAPPSPVRTGSAEAAAGRR